MSEDLAERIKRIENMLRHSVHQRAIDSLTLGDWEYARTLLSELENEVALIYFTTDNQCRHCRQEEAMLAELSASSQKVELEIIDIRREPGVGEKYNVDKVPCTALVGDKDYGIRYFGLPSGYEFRTLMQALRMVSRGVSDLTASEKEKVDEISVPVHIEVFTTGSCAFSNIPMRIGQQMAVENASVTADVIDVLDFPDLAKEREVMASPTVMVNETHRFCAPASPSEFVDRVVAFARQ